MWLHANGDAKSGRSGVDFPNCVEEADVSSSRISTSRLAGSCKASVETDRVPIAMKIVQSIDEAV